MYSNLKFNYWVYFNYLEVMEVLITGVSGFIGSHLAKALLNLNYKVIGIDNFATGNIKNIKGILDKNRFFLYEIDILNESDVIKVFKENKIDAVFHLAALPRVNYSFLYPEKTANVNVTGTINVLKASSEFGVKRFVFASSSSVYGDQSKFPLDESFITQPLSPYAIQKLTSESYCKLFYKQYDLNTICLRYFNVYGGYFLPSDTRFNCVVPSFINGLLNENLVVLNNSGNQIRDFTYIDDVTNANICAIHTSNEGAIGKSINIGGGIGTTMNDLLLNISNKLGKKGFSISNTKSKYKEPQTVVANIDLAGVLLEWSPKISLDVGIEKTVDFFNNQFVYSNGFRSYS